jgi:hypothetical protein
LLLADPGLAAEQQLDVVLRDALDQPEQIPVRVAYSDPRLSAHPHLQEAISCGQSPRAQHSICIIQRRAANS